MVLIGLHSGCSLSSPHTAVLSFSHPFIYSFSTPCQNVCVCVCVSVGGCVFDTVSVIGRVPDVYLREGNVFSCVYLCVCL